MTLPEVLKQALEGVPGLFGRVYPLEGLKNAGPPLAIYLRERMDEEDALDGGTGLLEAQYEVNIVHSAYAGMDTLGRAAKAALHATAGSTHDNITISRCVVTQEDPERYESNVSLWRRPYTVKFDYQED